MTGNGSYRMQSGDFRWPNGAYVAIVFNMSWESWPKALGTSGNRQRAGEVVPADAKYGRNPRVIYEHAYGETAGMQRLLDIWQRHEIRPSCYADGLNVHLYPELTRHAAALGTEFLAQGWDHTYLWDQTVQEQIESIERTVDTFEKVLGHKPAGFSAAGGTITGESVGLLAERGFKYVCGFRNTDVPFIIRHGNRKMVGMNSYALCDYNSYSHHDAPPRDVVQMFIDFFDTVYEEGQRGYPKMLAYGTHPFLSHGHRTRPMEEAIRYVKSKPNVWIATRGEIADWVLQNYPEHDLATFYPEAVSSDKWYGLSLGVGGDEAINEALSYRKK